MLKTPKIGLTMQWAALSGLSPLSFDFWVASKLQGFCNRNQNFNIRLRKFNSECIYVVFFLLVPIF